MNCAVEKDVPHEELEKRIGNRLALGWKIMQLVPSATYVVQTPAGLASSVTHWTVVLVGD